MFKSTPSGLQSPLACVQPPAGMGYLCLIFRNIHRSAGIETEIE